jgi:histidinol dehydrogenase
MPVRLNSKQTPLREIISNPLLAPKNGAMNSDKNIADSVAEIIRNIREKGDEALLYYTQKWDNENASLAQIIVPRETISKAHNFCSKEVLSALKQAATRIENYHLHLMPKDIDYTDEASVRLGQRWTAVDRVGIYVPGGLASYPSSVLMNAIPARVAGAKNLTMVVPAPGGIVNPLVLAAAHLVGIEEIFLVGGAQAIAALAFGTETIAPVDVIIGPGNAYVAEAKRQVFGLVGIDMIAGPSEVLVVADESANPKWVAMDLLSQAEHDPLARPILLCFSEEFADSVEQEINSALPTLSRAEIASKSWNERGVIVIAGEKRQALEIINAAAAEHLELCVENPRSWLPEIRHAGAVFLGSHTPEVFGDYLLGPSHVLPTSGTARFSSGISVYSFLKRQSVMECPPIAAKNFALSAHALAQEELLQAHALAALLRKGE